MDAVTLALAKSYINKKINEEGVVTGATPQQAAQIKQNKTDIADLQTEVDELKESGGSGSGQNANGLSATAAALLITILRGCRYLTEQGDNIAALEAELASSGGSETPDTPDTGVTITQSGSVLILSGVPAITSITKSGGVLALA